MLRRGDIFATKGEGLAGWAVRNLLTPSTDRFHFGFIYSELDDGDYVTLESTSPWGLKLGKLSWYRGRDIKFYRVSCPIDLRNKAPSGAIELSMAFYDFLLIAEFIVGAIRAIIHIIKNEHKIRKLQAEDLYYVEDSSPICTEVIDIGYDSVGVNLIPMGVAPIPNAFKQAELEGRMKELKFLDFNDD